MKNKEKERIIDELVMQGIITVEPNWARKYILPKMMRTGDSPGVIIYDWYIDGDN